MSRPKKGENHQVEVSELSWGFKVLARDLGVAVIARSQLNRSLEYRADQRPMPADIRGSGALGQDADVVAFIYRDDTYHPDSSEKCIAELIVVQAPQWPHRQDPPGVPRASPEVRHTGMTPAGRPPAGGYEFVRSTPASAHGWVPGPDTSSVPEFPQVVHSHSHWLRHRMPVWLKARLGSTKPASWSSSRYICRRRRARSSEAE